MKLMFCVINLIVAVCPILADEKESRVVQISSGPVRGYKEDGIYAFYSIPYAKAPSGPDRFKAPLPPSPWTDTFVALDYGIICPQNKNTIEKYAPFKNTTMKEDCLIANVLVPVTNERNLSVVVFVHGGAYQTGYGTMYSVNAFVRSKKIIAVTFNYRLGVHGFLCLGTKDAPGNGGMKDQVALLRWVNKNIDKFGGNPNDVTLDGTSAGASAVDLHVLSKTTVGLFNKVVSESGSGLAVWSVQINPLEIAKQYAKSLNFTNFDDVEALGEFYKALSYNLSFGDDFETQPDSTFVFTPCVERDTGAEMFLDEAPINILKRGDYNKVPTMYTFTNMEGMYRVDNGYDVFVKGMNTKFSNFLPADLVFESVEERETMAKRIKEFYFGNKTIGDETILEFIDYYSDVMFAYGILRSVKYHVAARHNQIYLSEYSYGTKQKLPYHVGNAIFGANHSAQCLAVFIESTPTNNTGFEELKTVMREIWHHFYTTSNPAPVGSSLPSWPPANASGAPYMELTVPPRLVASPPLNRRARFWDDIYEHHYRTPAPPPDPNDANKFLYTGVLVIILLVFLCLLCFALKQRYQRKTENRIEIAT